jgi:hypothetical protein
MRMLHPVNLLVGYNARASEIAKRYPAALLEKIDGEISEKINFFGGPDIDEAVWAQNYAQLRDQYPYAPAIRETLARLEKIYLFDDRAVLHFGERRHLIEAPVSKPMRRSAPYTNRLK